MDRFRILACSDVEYEKMVININYRNNQIAVLNCDKGDNQVEIKILDRYEDKVIWTFDCQSFIDTLKRALNKLEQINSKE